jgi:dihydrofolate reductase
MLVITANGLRLREATAPSTDVTNFGHIYIDSADANLKFRDESGEVTHIAGSGIATLANSATPTVVGGRLFLTGGTTTITDFTNGYTGQEIIILSEHAITITDGTNMFLSGSANFVMASTDSLHLVQKADGNWYEISRSVN